MATIPRRLHVVSSAEEAALNLPEQVTIALGELAGAVKQGVGFKYHIALDREAP
jgi:hypothetical protein